MAKVARAPSGYLARGAEAVAIKSGPLLAPMCRLAIDLQSSVNMYIDYRTDYCTACLPCFTYKFNWRACVAKCRSANTQQSAAGWPVFGFNLVAWRTSQDPIGSSHQLGDASASRWSEQYSSSAEHVQARACPAAINTGALRPMLYLLARSVVGSKDLRGLKKKKKKKKAE